MLDRNGEANCRDQTGRDHTSLRDSLRAELVSALCLDSLMLLCSAEHLLDHLDQGRGDIS